MYRISCNRAKGSSFDSYHSSHCITAQGWEFCLEQQLSCQGTSARNICWVQGGQPESAYAPMGSASPSLAQALASQASEMSQQGSVSRTASRLRNVSLRVPDG